MQELRRLFPTTQTRVLLFSAGKGSTCSVKDRPARAMLAAAEQLGILTSNTRIVEPTSGAGGISLASAAAAKGLNLTIVAPDDLDAQRKTTLQKLGAKLFLTPSKLGMTGAINVAKELAREDSNVWIPNFFENPANYAAHETETAPELWKEAVGKVDAFVCGVGSGGTFMGIARFLKQKDRNIRRIAVEPKESPVLSGGKPGNHGITGIGAGFIPKIFDLSLPTDIETASTDEAQEWSDRLAKDEGILAGISTGANLAAVAKLVKQREWQGKTIIAVAFDCGR